MKKSFSLIEILFVLILLAIISSIAISKISSNINSSILLKAKSDIALIRSALNDYKNKMILKQQTMDLQTLDDASFNTKSLKLFTNIIDDVVFISTSNDELKQGLWIKTSNNKYMFVLSKEDKIEFSYDSVTNKFECNILDDYCSELIE
jgi:general secretion pathway protein G